MNFGAVDTVIFDLDGTLTDPRQGITGCVVFALSGLGYEAPEPSDLEWFIGPPLLRSFMELTGCDAEEGNRLIEKYRERYRTAGVHENLLYPGVEEMLAALHCAGKILAVASSKPEPFVREILKDFGLTKYFAVIEGSDFAGKHVEKTDVLSSALRLLRPQNAVMVGDRKFDVEAARQLGLGSIGVRYGYAQGNELETAGADVIVDSPAEIGKIILDMDR